MQGNGSGAALAIMDAVTKHNERNPGKEVLYLNYAAVDPDLTNSKCNYWHFRLDADTSMKMEALTTFMKDQPDDQEGLPDQPELRARPAGVAKFAKEDLARKRPDIQIVGDDLHPLAQVRDFAPYVAKIKASGADTVVTGNWGSDLTLLVKAAQRRRPERQVLHLLRRRHRHAHRAGRRRPPAACTWWPTPTPTCRARSASWPTSSRPSSTTTTTPAPPTTRSRCSARRWPRPRAPTRSRWRRRWKACSSRASTATSRCARPTTSCSRRLFITVWQKADAKHPYSVENTGYNFQTVKYYEPYVASTPTSCQMKRPGSALSFSRCGDAACSGSRPAGASSAGPFLLSAAVSSPPWTRSLINVLNGVSSGLLLFMLSSGLTLIFSMMGVLNFAHASFYMLGAYFAYTLTRLCRLLAGAGASRRWWSGCSARCSRRTALRRVHKFGHVPELLITFGLSYVMLELVQLVWGRTPVPFDAAGVAAGPGVHGRAVAPTA